MQFLPDMVQQSSSDNTENRRAAESLLQAKMFPRLLVLMSELCVIPINTPNIEKKTILEKSNTRLYANQFSFVGMGTHNLVEKFV